MSDSILFLESLYGPDYAGPLDFIDKGCELLTASISEMPADAQRFYPTSSDSTETPFVYALDKGVEEDAWLDAVLRPSAVIRKGEVNVMFWALEAPTGVKLVQSFLDRFEVFLDDPIPLPGFEGWTLIHADVNEVHTLDAVLDTYCPVTEEAPAEAPEAVAQELVQTATPGFWRGARIATPGYDPDADPDLKEQVVISVGASRDSKKWVATQLSVRKLFETLVNHTVGPKDGPGFVGGKVLGKERKADAVEYETLMGFDFDNGTPIAEIEAVVLKSGLKAVLYTTHSNMKTSLEIPKSRVTKFAEANNMDFDEDDCTDVIRALMKSEGYHPTIYENAVYHKTEHVERGIMVFATTPPIPKVRVVFFLEKPFVFAKEGRDQQAAKAKWKKLVNAVACSNGLEFYDKSGTDPSRLFYLPRHDKGRPYEAIIFGGKRLDLDKVDLGENDLVAIADALAGGGRPKSKSKTEEGRALNEWFRKHRASGFQAADIFEAKAPDKVRFKVDKGLEVECPFDDEHSNPGDPTDRACLVSNAGDFVDDCCTFKCQHEGCRDKTLLDMLGRAIKLGWFCEDDLWDEEFNSVEGLEGRSGFAEKFHPVSNAALPRLRVEIENLPELPEVDQLRQLVYSIARAGVDRADTASLWLALEPKASKVGFNKSTYNAFLKDYKIPATSSPKKLSKNTQILLTKVNDELALSLEMPPSQFGDIQLTTHNNEYWYEEIFDQGSRLLAKVFFVESVVRYVDDGGDRYVRILTRDRGRWERIEIPAENLATNTKAVGQLLAKGLPVMGNAGANFVQQYLAYSVGGKGADVVVRPGFRDLGGVSTFVCPTGEVIPHNSKIELAPSTQLKSRHVAGTFEAAREGLHSLYRADGFDPQHFAGLIGLGGPILDLGRLQNFTVEYYGLTGFGKSTLQEMGASYWGEADLEGNGLLFSAKATDNSFENRLMRSSGTIAAADEMRFLTGKEYKNLIYMHSGAVGKGRMQSDLSSQGQKSWRTILWVSSESSFAARMRAEGLPLDPGLSARLLSVCVDGKPELPDEVFKRVQSTTANFGYIGPAFIEAMQAQGYDKDKVSGEVKRLANILADSGTNQVIRAARMPAVFWLAGQIAQTAGLIPGEFDLEGLIGRIWAEQLAGELSAKDPAQRAAKEVIGQLYSLRGNRIRKITILEGRKLEIFVDGSNIEAWGYYGLTAFDAKTAQTVPVYVMRAKPLAQLVPHHSSKALYKALLDLGTLIPDTRGKNTWSGYPGLGKGEKYVVLRADHIEDDGDLVVANQ